LSVSQKSKEIKRTDQSSEIPHSFYNGTKTIPDRLPLFTPEMPHTRNADLGPGVFELERCCCTAILKVGNFVLDRVSCRSKCKSNHKRAFLHLLVKTYILIGVVCFLIVRVRFFKAGLVNQGLTAIFNPVFQLKDEDTFKSFLLYVLTLSASKWPLKISS